MACRLAIISPYLGFPSGLPAVVQRLAGTLLREGVQLTLIGEKSDLRLRHLQRRLHRDPPRLAAMAGRCRPLIRERYLLEHELRTLLTLYRFLIAKGPRPLSGAIP